MMRKFLFILPHPDDGEVLTPNMIQHALVKGYAVIEHLSCCDEYGTTNDEWKGKKIQAIRRIEMENSARVYYEEILKKLKNGQENSHIIPIQVLWGPFIDGHVPHNKESVQYYRNLILSIKPYAVFIPDPFFPIGTHHDHINTGKSAFFALKSLNEQDRPKIMLMYQSFKPNRSIMWADPQITHKARMAHRSQWPEIEMLLLAKVEKIFMRSNKYRFKNVEPYRKFTFDNRDLQLEKFWQKLVFVMITKMFKPGNPGKSRFSPPPEELKRMGRL